MAEIINNEDEVITTEVVGTEIIYQQDKAQIDTQIATAKAYPRDIKQAVQDSIATVTMDIATAQSCNYALPRGGKTINGPSIHLALILAQNWGNLRIEAKITAIDSKTITSQAVCFDLQKNIAIKVEVKRSIMTKTGRMNDDMITVTGNAANSISLRNAILKVIPKAVVDNVSNAAKKLILGDVSDETKLIKRVNEIIDKFLTSYGVTEAEILNVLGKPNKASITSDNLVTLIGYAQSIKDGDATAVSIFRSKEEKVANKKEALKNAKANLSSKNAESKISTQEEKKQETPSEDINVQQAIENCQTEEELLAIQHLVPKDNLDFEIIYSDKMKALKSNNDGLFNQTQMP